MDAIAYWLPVVWAAIIGIAVALYVILDGFDLGLGILFPFTPEEERRDVMMNSVAPFWDGNETWLVLGGGGLLVAFPLAYAVIMPALYLPIIIMLLGLISPPRCAPVQLSKERVAVAAAISELGAHQPWWWERDGIAGEYCSEAMCLGHASTSEFLILILGSTLTEITRKEFFAAKMRRRQPSYSRPKVACGIEGRTDSSRIRALLAPMVNTRPLLT